MSLAPDTSVGRYATRAIGTRAEILTADPDAIDDAAELLRAGLEWIDALASRFRADSELGRLNAASGHDFPASPNLVEALEVAVRAARLTGGAVTPTVGRALCLLGYDRDFSAMDHDQSGPLPAASPVPSWETVVVDPVTRTVRIPRGVEVDLGATAKAWAADRMAAEAGERLGCGILVSLGGDVSTAGTAPIGGWRVGVADVCDAGTGTVETVVVLRDGGLATSGTAGRSWRRAGHPVHHLVDPATGRSAESCWRTVTVAAATCTDANIAATAAVLAGPRAPKWLSEWGLPARLVSTSGTVVSVGAWPGRPEEL